MHFPYTLIDLTHPIYYQVPTWENDSGFGYDLIWDYADCSSGVKFRVMKMHMHAGIGTHLDAPAHCFPGAPSVADLKIQDLLIPCIVIDVAEKSHEAYSLSEQDIVSFEETKGTIPEGSAVFIHTGWARYWEQRKKYHNNHNFPGVSREAAQLLLSRGINALGIDTLSPDRPENNFKVHEIFLGSGKIIIENVNNLHLMPVSGAHVLIAPLKAKDLTEAPVRLVGFVKQS